MSSLWKRAESGTDSALKVDAPILAELEPRILFSASPIDPDGLVLESEADLSAANTFESTLTVPSDELQQLASLYFDGGVDDLGRPTGAGDNSDVNESNAPDNSLGNLQESNDDYLVDPAANLITDAQLEIIFVDQNAPDYMSLVEDLVDQIESGRNLRIVTLQSGEDGISQITNVLNDYSDVAAVHIISHGAPGQVKLGNTWLGIDNLDAYSGQVASWNNSLQSGADLLIYGCDLASTAEGQTLTQSLAELCDCDVATSDDATGLAEQGGDWELEYKTGQVEADIAFSFGLQENWANLLATSETHYFLTGSGIPQADLTEPIPTATSVPDYDSGRHSGAGTLISKGGSGFAESDSVKHQEWKLGSGGFTLDGPAKLTIFSAVKDFNTSKGATVHAYLLDVANNGSDPQLLASDTISRGTWNPDSGWIEDTFDFGNITKTFSGSRRLQVKVVVDGGSDDDLLFAYDSVFQRSHLQVGLTTSNADPAIAMGGSPLEYTENDTPSEVDSGIGLSDDDANMDWATVQITSGFNASEDVLVFSDSLPAGITMEADSASGQIVFYGDASISDYESVLKLVRYENTSDDPDVTQREVTFKVYDGQNLSTATQTINITAVNDEPTVNSTASDTGLEDQDVVYTHAQMLSLLGATDPDNTNAELTVNITSVTNASFLKSGSGNGTTYTFSYTQPTHANGFDVTFDYEVEDPAGLKGSGGPATITVQAVNDRPSLTLGSDQTVDEDTGFHSVAGFASPLAGGGTDENGQTFTYNVSAANNSLFAVGPAIDSSGNLTYTLANDAFGSTTITVSVRDSGGTANGGQNTSFNEFFDININNVNDDAFVATNNPLNVVEGTAGTISNTLLEVDDVDSPAASTLVYTVTVAPTLGQLELTTGPGTPVSSFTQADIDAGRLVYVHAGAETPTTDSFTFTATDGIGSATSPTVFNINISPGNDAPINTVPGAQVTPQNTSLEFSATNSNQVSVNDTDAGASDVEVTISVANGTVTLDVLDPAVAQGPEAMVNPASIDPQQNVSIASDAAGNHIVVYDGVGTGDSQGVFGQLFDANGSPVGIEFRVNPGGPNKNDAQSNPSVAMNASGDFVVVWQGDVQDGSGYGIFAQRYNSAGVAQGGEIAVNDFTTGSQVNPDVAIDPSGNFVVTWQGQGASDTGGIYARRFSSAGVAQGGQFSVNNTDGSSEEAPAIAIDSTGNFVIAWETSSYPAGTDNHQEALVARRFDASGVAQGSDFQVNTTTFSKQHEADIGMDATGNFVVVWRDHFGDSSNAGIISQRYAANGAPVGGETLVNTFVSGHQEQPTIAMNADGTYVVSWQSQNIDGSGLAVVAQQFAADGTPIGGEQVVNTTTSLNQRSPAVAINADGDFFVAWEGNGTGDSNGVFHRTYHLPDIDVTFSSGDGISDSSMTFRGTLSEINNVLDGMRFTPTTGFTGLATIDITTNDLGNTGAGGALQDFDSISIEVTADTTPPVLVNNNGITLNEGALSGIANTELRFDDSDQPATNVTYTVTSGLANGQLELTTAPLTPVTSFTQDDIDAGRLVYRHDGSDTTSDSFVFDVDDGVGNSLTAQSFSITVNAVDDSPPGVVNNAGKTLNEGDLAAIVNTELRFDDSEQPASSVTYTVTGGLVNGQLELTTALFTPITSFTQDDIDGGRLVYRHDGSPTTNDSFTFDVDDGQGNSVTSQSFTLTISAIDNDPPTVVNNTGLTLNEGALSGISNVQLRYDDTEQPATDVTYTVTGGLANGQLESTSAPFVAITTFSQDLIDSGRLVYRHDGSETTNDSFTFDVDDGQGNSLTSQSFAITVNPVNDNDPVITSNGGGATAGINVNENTLFVTNVAATDADLPGQTISYALIGGADMAKFSIDSVTGELTFTQRPDFEAPTDVGADNVYDVIVEASDGAGRTDSQQLAITILDVDLIASDSFSYPTGSLEGLNGGSGWTSSWTTSSPSSMNVVATSLADATTTLATSGGSAQMSTITQFAQSRDLSTTIGYDNSTVWFSFLLEVDSLSGGISLELGDFSGANDSVSIGTSGNDFLLSIDRNPIGGTTIDNVLVDGQTYLLVAEVNFLAGADTVTLYVDPTPGLGSPDSPGPMTAQLTTADLGQFTKAGFVGGFTGNNSRVDELRVGESFAAVTPILSNVPPVINSNGGGNSAAINVNENTTTVTTVTATDADLPAQTLSYSIVGGLDQALFSIDSVSGELTFQSAPDFESPADSNSDNIYEVTVQVNDGVGGVDAQTISVTVDNLDDTPPAVVNNNGVTLNEGAIGGIANTDLRFDDTEQPATSVTYTVTGGLSNGQLELTTAPLTPVASFTQDDIDSGRLVYRHDGSDTTSDNFNFNVDDGQGNTLSAQVFSINVTAVDDTPPTLVNNNGITVSEGGLGGIDFTELRFDDTEQPATSVTYTVTSGLANGQLELTTAPLTPITSFTQDDINAGRLVYRHDGSNTTSDSFNFDVDDGQGNAVSAQTFSIIVTATDNTPPAPVNNNGLTLNEGAVGGIANTELRFDDTEQPATNVTYTVTGGLANGQLELTTSPFVSITSFTQDDIDSGRLVYRHDGSDTTSDGFNFDVDDGQGNSITTQSFAIGVTAVDDSPPAVVNNTGMTLALGTASGIDNTELRFDDSEQPATSVTYSVNGGLTNGQLELTTAPLTPITSFTQDDIDSGRLIYRHNGSPTNSDIFNFDVDDGQGNTVSGQSFFISVTTTNLFNPVFTSGAAHNVDENRTVVHTLSATDGDFPAQTISYSVKGTGADDALFTINGANQLVFLSPRDFENPGDVGGDNVYNVDVEASDGAGGLTVQSISVTINDVNEQPIAVDDAFETANGVSLDIQKSDLLANDKDPENGFLTVTIVSPPANGTLIVNPDNSFTFQPNTGFNGSDFFVYEIDDGVTGTVSATVNLTVVAATPPEPPADTDAPADSGSSEPESEEEVKKPVANPELVEEAPPAPSPVATKPVVSKSLPTRPEARESVNLAEIFPETEDSEAPSFMTTIADRKIDIRAGRQLRSGDFGFRPGMNSEPLIVETESFVSTGYIEVLDQFQDEVQQDDFYYHGIVNSTIAVTGSISVGYVVWMIRGGVLMSSILSSLPAWKMIDPLPILGDGAMDGDEDDESLESMVEKSNAEPVIELQEATGG